MFGLTVDTALGMGVTQTAIFYYPARRELY